MRLLKFIIFAVPVFDNDARLKRGVRRGEGEARKVYKDVTLYFAIWSTVQESTASLPTGVVTLPMGAVNSGTSNMLCFTKPPLATAFTSPVNVKQI